MTTDASGNRRGGLTHYALTVMATTLAVVELDSDTALLGTLTY